MMKTFAAAPVLSALFQTCFAAPMSNSTSTDGPVPGFSDSYIDYMGKAPPFPANMTAPIKATAKGPPGPDDQLWQNLLAAEWIIFSFYQTAVESFNQTDFTKAGFPNSTYANVQRIRDNEAGHLRIFQDAISPTSLKPGACTYQYNLTDVSTFMALQSVIEIGSQAFLTGLARGAVLPATRSALMAVSDVETRHNTWALIEAWGASPFVGAADTVFPYPNQVLDTTNQFVVSCPSENPEYPSPNQHLPQLRYNTTTSDGRPGSNITLSFALHEPAFQAGKDYHAVFFHGVQNVTMPFDTATNATTIPEFDDAGLIVVVVADAAGAPTKESVLAGPLLLVEQPAQLTRLIAD